VTIEIVRPGMLTTVQDEGRFGCQSLGIGPGGAMDLDATRLANVLVGNDESAAVLEATLVGPVLRFAEDSLLALTGAIADARIDNARIPHRRAVFVPAGAEVAVGPCASGCRVTLAIAGGVDVVPVLGSRSSNVRAHFGGFDGRPLRAGDRVPVGPLSNEARQLLAALRSAGRQWIAESHGLDDLALPAGSEVTVRVIAGTEWSRLDDKSRDVWFASPFTVGQRSDRMGYRLEGPALNLVDRQEMISEGVVWGAIQLPPDGQPIILGADRPTTGGYPVIGHVASIDRSAIAQMKPGDRIRFTPISLANAHEAWSAHDRQLTEAIDALRRRRAPQADHDPR
jgi:antagonist of KipI